MKRKKYLAILLTAAVLTSTALAGCGTNATPISVESTEQAETSATIISSTFTGTVTAVDGDSITVTPDEDSNDLSTDTSGSAKSSDAILTEDGSIAMTISDSSVISKGGPGGNGAPGGNENGTPPEKPDGDNTQAGDSNGTPPEKPDGDNTQAGDSNGMPPEKPDGDSTQAGDSNGTPPEKPDGDSAASGETSSADQSNTDQSNTDQSNTDQSNTDQSSTESESNADTSDENASSGQPEGQQPGNGKQPDSDADSSSTTLQVGDTVTVTVDENGAITEVTLSGMQGGPGGNGAPDGNGGNGAPDGNGGPGGNAQNGVDSYTAANEISEDTSESGQTYESDGTDEEAVLVTNGATASLSDATITRSSEDSSGGDSASFYGVGAAALVTDGTLNIDSASITTDSAGGAGVFAYGDGTANVSNATIKTTQGTSGGLHAAGGGTLNAWDCTVETDGGSAAAIRSDRGGGTMVIDGGSYTANGSGSPAVYCTADISVNDAELTATGSEGICIEGLNTLRLYDTDLTCNMPDDSQNDTTWSVILYQSMSGDSEEGNSTFSMQGGSITSENGGVFYSTNTESTFYLNDVDIKTAEDAEFFLQVTGNANQRGWGNTGANGADTNFTANAQTMEGNVIYDSISNLDFYMENGSSLTGAIIDDETWAGDGGDGTCNVYISSDSTWTVTGDSVVTNLYNEGTITDVSGNAVTIKDTDGNVLVEGTSSYTITVSSYGTSADFSGASQSSSFEAADSPFVS